MLLRRVSHLVSNSSNFSKSTPFLTRANCKTVEDVDGYPGTLFFKYWDFHPLLWKSISACTVRLFSSQGTARGSGAKGAVSLGVHQKETRCGGLDLLLPTSCCCCWRQMDLPKVFSDVIWIPWVSGARAVTVALLEGSTWVLITRY